MSAENEERIKRATAMFDQNVESFNGCQALYVYSMELGQTEFHITFT